jgi:DNA replication protein DnaC
MEYLTIKPDGITVSGNPLFEPEHLPRVEKDCPLHGTFMAYKIFPSEDIFSSCPRCSAERDQEINREREREQQKKEQEAALTVADYEKMNIPPLFYGEDLDTFEADTEELQYNMQVVRRLCHARRGKILMVGKHGTGKTHLAIAALKQFRTGRIYTRLEVNLLIRQTYQRGENREKEILDSLIKTRFLVIDEFEKTSGSRWEAAWVSHVFNKRHEYLQPIIIISALTYPEKKREGTRLQSLERLLGPYIMSRLKEDGIVLHFTGRDRRQEKRRRSL